MVKASIVNQVSLFYVENMEMILWNSKLSNSNRFPVRMYHRELRTEALKIFRGFTGFPMSFLRRRQWQYHIMISWNIIKKCICNSLDIIDKILQLIEKKTFHTLFTKSKVSETS